MIKGLTAAIADPAIILNGRTEGNVLRYSFPDRESAKSRRELWFSQQAIINRAALRIGKNFLVFTPAIYDCTSHVHIDSSGNVIVTDCYNYKIDDYSIRDVVLHFKVTI